MIDIGITASFCYLPARRISNESICRNYLKHLQEKNKTNNLNTTQYDITQSENTGSSVSEETLASKIEKNTGILNRRYCLPNEATSDVATKSFSPFLNKNIELKNKIGALIIATTSSDFPSPATANWVHKGLDLDENVICLDIASSCSSFLSSMLSALGFISAELNPLIIAAEVKHKGIASDDFRSLSLFADGAGGIFLEKMKNETQLLITHSKINSSLSHHICTPVGGTREPVTVENIHKNKIHILEPKNLFIYTVKEIILAIEKSTLFLEKKGENKFFNIVFIHQANKNIIIAVKENISKKIAQKIPLLISDIGNTACASLPMLRARFNFLRALVHETRRKLKKDEIIPYFLLVCKNNKNFYYEKLTTGFHFCAQWRKEKISIFDDGCESLQESWLSFLCEGELNEIVNLIYEEVLTHSQEKYLDLWVVAGGGFQTLALAHKYL